MLIQIYTGLQLLVHTFKFGLVMVIGFVIAITITDAKSEQSLELNKAIEAWLDYDDETALPLLSSLANSGNEDAMLLLGQINVRSSDFSPYLKSLCLINADNLQISLL